MKFSYTYDDGYTREGDSTVVVCKDRRLFEIRRGDLTWSKGRCGDDDAPPQRYWANPVEWIESLTMSSDGFFNVGHGGPCDAFHILREWGGLSRLSDGKLAALNEQLRAILEDEKKAPAEAPAEADLPLDSSLRNADARQLTACRWAAEYAFLDAMRARHLARALMLDAEARLEELRRNYEQKEHEQREAEAVLRKAYDRTT